MATRSAGRAGMARCPLCGSRAIVGDVTVASTGKVRYFGACKSESCRLSEAPSLTLCDEDEAAAVERWNSLADSVRRLEEANGRLADANGWLCAEVNELSARNEALKGLARKMAVDMRKADPELASAWETALKGLDG